MIHFEKYKLDNGLTVILHQDKTTPIAVINTIINAGARDEHEDRTGFAHLFEHLMFGGSKHIENFDTPLQKAGGESNAFTNNDITNYYSTLPVENIETALWLESDRLLELAFTDKSLEVQRNVVIEEFKQRYLNQPYGDAWLEFRPLIFKNHPYKWATIGKNIDHIANATMADVKAFFYKHYGPQNAVLVIGGNIDIKLTKKLVEKWYGNIPARDKYIRQIEAEPNQLEYREKTIYRDVPSNAIYMAFRIGNRTSNDHYIGDLISDILSSGKSSRLYQILVKTQKKFTDIQAYISSGWEHGLFIVSGQIFKGVTPEEAESAIWDELEKLKTDLVIDIELEKVKNKLKTVKAFQDQSVLSRVMNIAQFELLGILDNINSEEAAYNQINNIDIQKFSKQYFLKNNASTLKINPKS